MAFHEFVGVASWGYIYRHGGAVVSEVVADAAPADGHGVAFGGVSRAENEVFGKEGEAIVGEVLLHVKGFFLYIFQNILLEIFCRMIITDFVKV